MDNVKGLDDLLKKMNALPDRLKRRAIVRSARKGANIIRDKARLNAQRFDDKETAESIAKNTVVSYSSRASKRLNAIVMRIGVMGGAKQYANTKANVRAKRAGKTYKTLGDKSNPGGDTWYWRFLEFGTEKMRAQPFLRDAADKSVQESFNIIADDLGPQIDKEIERL